MPFLLAEPLRTEFHAALQDAAWHMQALARAVGQDPALRAKADDAVREAMRELARVGELAGLPARPGPPVAKRFLVVDDSEDMRRLVPRVVRKLHPGALVQVARDAPEALGLLHDASEGEGLVIISDYDMGPGPTGAELLAEVALRHPLAKRLLLTGRAPESLVRARVEPDAILSKDDGMRGLREFLAPARPGTP